MRLGERPPSGILLGAAEKVAGYARQGSVWPAGFGPSAWALEAS